MADRTFTVTQEGYSRTFTITTGVVTTGGSSGDMLAANNLSDVASVSTSRTNLGLGTAATAATGDFAAALGADDNYVTDAEKTVIGNTSGTNTGDQDLSGLQAEPSEGAFADGDKTKLDGIEASADVTDTTNVTAAGALMDSEVTNLAQVKAFDSTDYATSAQGSLADSATQPGDLGTAAALDVGTGANEIVQLNASSELPAVSGANLTNLPSGATELSDLSDVGTSTPTNRNVLIGDGTNFDSRALTEADISDLGTYSTATGVENNADVTDTTNVTAAGALMDSELASIADVKALDQSVVSGASPTFSNANITEATNKNYVTDAEQTVIGNTSGTNTGDEPAASTTTAGVAEIATAAEVSTGTDTGRVISPDSLEASTYNWQGPAGITLGAEDTDLTASTTVPLASFHVQRAFTLIDAPFGCTTGPTGSAATFDIHKNSTTIYSTKPTIDAGEDHTSTAATPAVLSVTSFAVGDFVEIFCDSVGATVAGAGGKCYINAKHPTS